MSLRYRLLGIPANFDEFQDRMTDVDQVRIGTYTRRTGLHHHHFTYAAHPDHHPAQNSFASLLFSRDIYLKREPAEDRDDTLEVWAEKLDGAGFTPVRADITHPYHRHG